jgi:hypothetical protein
MHHFDTALLTDDAWIVKELAVAVSRTVARHFCLKVHTFEHNWKPLVQKNRT